MKCIRCNRPIIARPAATVRTRQGVSAWGPVCARKAGLLQPAERRASAPIRPSRRVESEDQLPLMFV